MSYQFDGEFIEKFYLTFTMLAYESNRRFLPRRRGGRSYGQV